MKDLQTIVRRARELDEQGLSYVLATVVQTSGSVYRGPGTRMLIEENLQSLGTISSGCLEGDVRENASEVFAEGTPRLLHYDATSEDDSANDGGNPVARHPEADDGSTQHQVGGNEHPTVY